MARSTPLFQVGPGTVLYANHVSYVELLWLAHRSACRRALGENAALEAGGV